MELVIYLWTEDVKDFVTKFIHFLKTSAPEEEIEYEEKYYKLDQEWDRDIYFKGIGIGIPEHDMSFVTEIYDTLVNIAMWIDIISWEYDEKAPYLAEMINWIMRTSDTDIALESGDLLIFKRVKGKIYYRKDYEFFPFDVLDIDKEKAIDLV